MLTVQICLITNMAAKEQGNSLRTCNAPIPYFPALHLGHLFYVYTFHVI